jgi:RNA polymerase sigma-70 factor (ECF subfamily)
VKVTPETREQLYGVVQRTPRSSLQPLSVAIIMAVSVLKTGGLPLMSPSLGDRTPHSLLERLCQPNNHQAWQKAWEDFVELYTPLLVASARRLGLSREDALEVVHDVFLQLVEKLPHFHCDRNRRFRGWLWTLVRNRVVDRQRRPDGADGAVSLVTDMAASEDPLAEWAENEYRQHVVGRALHLMRLEFKETTWKACWETVVEGRKPSEVAQELGVSVDSVYQAKTRVLRRLRGELEGLLD